MLSTPPAFNLSQNQTLQFKSVQDSCFRRNRNLKDFLPTRYSLVNEPLGLSGPPPFRAARRRLMPPFVLAVNNFFSIHQNSFRRRCFELYAVFQERERLMLPFRNPVNFFLPVRRIFFAALRLNPFPCRETGICLKGAQLSTDFLHFFQNIAATNHQNADLSARGAPLSVFPPHEFYTVSIT